MVLAFAVVASGGGSTWVGVVLACSLGAQALLLPVGGVVADRWDRRTVIVVAYLLQGLAQVVIGSLLLVVPGSVSPWHFAGAALVTGVTGAAGQPALQGRMVELVPVEGLQDANAVLRLVLNLARVALPGLGATAGAVWGYGPVLVVAGATLVVAAAAMGSGGAAGVRSSPRPGTGVRGQLLEGWRAVGQRPWLLSYLVVGTLVVPLWLAGYLLLSPLLLQGLQGGVAWWGWAVSAFGAGMVAGSVVGMHWRPRRLLLATTLVQLPWPLPLAVVALVADGTVPVVWLLPAMVLSGLLLDLSVLFWHTVVQQHVSAHLIGRVSSIQMVGEQVLVPVGYVLAGAVAGAVGAVPVLWICFAGIVVLTLALLLVPSVRGLERAARG